MPILKIPRKRSLLLFSLSILVVGYFCMNLALVNQCNDVILNEYLSPTKDTVVRSYERDCGATTDFSTIVSIGKSSQLPQENLTLIAAAKGRISLNIEWITESQLRIKSTGSFVNKRDRFENIAITYQQLVK